MFDHGTTCTDILKNATSTGGEAARLASLKACRVLDTPEEAVYDALTSLAGTICGTSMALISLVDSDRVWFKSHVGIDVRERERQGSFCTIAIGKTELFQVPNALNDPRFRDSEVVTGPLGIRFYCGIPLIDSVGQHLGVMCVLDRQPRRLSDVQCNALRQLATVVMYLLENRRDDPQVLDLGVMIERSRDAPAALGVNVSPAKLRNGRLHTDLATRAGTS